MAVLPVTPLVLKDVLLTIGTGTPDDFAQHVSGVTFTPSSSQITWSGLGKNTHTDQGLPTWTVQLDYVQDWTSVNSLSRYLFTNQGQTVPMKFKPLSGSGPSFSANVSIVSGAIGGQVNAYATTSVTLGCDTPVLAATVEDELSADEATTTDEDAQDVGPTYVNDQDEARENVSEVAASFSGAAV